MMHSRTQIDLVILVPDGDMEATVRTLLQRPEAIGIRPISIEIRRHIQRDPGCRIDGHNFLRLWLNRARYALILLDHEGSGAEIISREALEEQIEGRLSSNGWQNRCAAVAISPELENWAWTPSAVLDDVLGWANNCELKTWVKSKTKFWRSGLPKPERPKEALDAALKEARKRHSPAVFEDIAKNAPVSKCVDASFLKFKDVLQQWFAESEQGCTSRPPESVLVGALTKRIERRTQCAEE
jgi:hypothetical protein